MERVGLGGQVRVVASNFGGRCPVNQNSTSELQGGGSDFLHPTVGPFIVNCSGQ